MYRLKIKIGKRWACSLYDYTTLEKAQERSLVLTMIGIKNKIVDAKTLYNNAE